MIYCTIEIEPVADDFDADGNVRAERIASWFQDASQKHVDLLHLGPDDLLKKDLMWALTKLKIEISSTIQPGKKYKCITFPVSQKAVTFKRDYYITEIDTPDIYDSEYDESYPDMNRALIRGSGQWCVMNFKTRKLEKSGIVFDLARVGSDAIPGRFPKIHGRNLIYGKDHVVCEEDIDFNDHCNNSRYIEFAEEAAGKRVKENLFINFASETRLGDRIKMYYEDAKINNKEADNTAISRAGRDLSGSGDKQQSPDEIFVEGRSDDDELIFQMKYR